MRLLAILAGVALFSYASSQPETVTVLRFRQLWDGERLIANATVVVQGDRIVAVGPKVDVPKDSSEIDLRRQ